MNKSESITEIAKAMSQFQANVKQPLKDKENPFYKSKYVPFENVVESVTESASKLGLSFIQYPTSQDARVGVVTLLMHTSGEWIETEPVFATPVKQDPQSAGAAITYLKRYSLSAVFGITSDEDDDGNSNVPQQNKQNNYNKKNNQPQQQNNYQQSAPSVNNNLITAPQMKALKAKLTNISKNTGVEAQAVYLGALGALNIPTDIGSKELSKAQAVKVISYLAEQEEKFATTQA